MLLSAWLVVGLAVGLRGRRSAWERALAVCFWPFFLVVPAGLDPAAAGAAPADARAPLARLRAALAPDDPAHAVIDRLAAALDRQQARLSRLEAAAAGAGPVAGDEPALAQARQRSRALLFQARDRERAALGGALAAVEEAATRLWLLRERGEPAEVEALLRGLVARLDAGVEVEGLRGQEPARSSA